MPPSEQRPHETLREWRTRTFEAPVQIAAAAVEQAKREAETEETRIVRGGAFVSLLLVAAHLSRTASKLATAPVAVTVHSLDVAQAALRDIRDALVAAQIGGE